MNENSRKWVTVQAYFTFISRFKENIVDVDFSELIQRSAAYDWHPFQRSSGVDSKDIRTWVRMASAD